MSSCVFCDIVGGKREQQVHRTENGVTVFDDLDRLSNHTLAVPNEHVENARSLSASHIPMLKELEAQRTAVIYYLPLW